VALLGSNIEGAVTGFLCGLTQDMLSGRVIGFYALLGLYLGLGIALINKRLYKENVLVAIFTTFVSSIIYEFAVYFFVNVFKGSLELIFVRCQLSYFFGAAFETLLMLSIKVCCLTLQNSDQNNEQRK